MDKSEDQSYDDFRLRKDEIIRGHDSYLRILKDSIAVSTELLKAFVNRQSKQKNPIDFNESPLFTHSVKVGFIIAKKKIRKSFFRNRMRRLLKESYRLNRNKSGLQTFKINIIFTLNEKGYSYFKKNPDTKRIFIDEEMKALMMKIKNKYTVK